VDPRPEDFFRSPGDYANLLDLTEIHPQDLNEEDETFGIALLNVQADIPDTIPGQAVIFMLLGDARLTNEVAPDDDEGAPFQSFYFLPGIGRSNCYEADPMLTIQTPGNITINIVLNGVDTEMSPGTLLTITPNVCTIHRGNIIQWVGDNTAVLLANQTVDIHIAETGEIFVDNLRGISAREFERGVAVQQALNAIAVANGWPEQYVSTPDEFDDEPPAAESTAEPADDTPDVAPTETDSTCEVEHTVSRGESIHRIAQRYNTSALSIVEANQLENPRLVYVGQVLCIPQPDSGFEPLPAGI
jgi:hypothetical protein